MNLGNFQVSTATAGRRVRYMETTDFGGATRFIFSRLNDAFVHGHRFQSVFMAVEMDQSSAGAPLYVETISPMREDLVCFMTGSSEDASASISQWLLDRPLSAASLIASVHPRYAESTSSDNPALQSLAFELQSIDSMAVANFRALHGQAGQRARLIYSPLTYRSRISR